MKGAVTMGDKGSGDKGLTIEYVLFPVERHFRHLRADGGRDAHRFKRYYTEKENAGWKGRRYKKRRDDGTVGDEEDVALGDNLLSRILEKHSVCVAGLNCLNYNDPLPFH